MSLQGSNFEEDLKEIRLLTFNTITRLTELNRKLKALEENHSIDDLIIMYWNKGYNRNQITKRVNLSYNTVSRRIDNLIRNGMIKERGHNE